MHLQKLQDDLEAVEIDLALAQEEVDILEDARTELENKIQELEDSP